MILSIYIIDYFTGFTLTIIRPTEGRVVKMGELKMSVAWAPTDSERNSGESKHTAGGGKQLPQSIRLDRKTFRG